MTAQNKSSLIDALALAFEERTITLPHHPILIHELQAFEMEQYASGLWRYSAPSGGHDDLVIALALAWHAASQTRVARVRLYA